MWWTYVDAGSFQPWDADRELYPDEPDREDRAEGDAVTLSRGTTGADYLTARIARDHPAILTRMQAGVPAAPIGSSPITESQASQLAPLLNSEPPPRARRG